MAVFDNIKKENGSVTIEATISLSAFMFAIVTLLTIVNICIVQAKMSYAINTTAREISQYSYLYSITGINSRHKEIFEAGESKTQKVKSVLSDVNTVYNEIENLGDTGNQSFDNINDIIDAWNGVSGSVENIEGAGSSIVSNLEEIAKDPKNLLFGIAQLGASETFDLAKSRLIAAPLAKALCKKNLVDEKDGNVDAYLKFLGVVPSASGSYIDGLDFSKSSLFPNGSSEIKINVAYDVKVIALLPIDFHFHFNQTAITHGWQSGEVDFKTNKEKIEENKTLWTESTVTERANYIRHMVIADLQKEGYEKTTGLTDVQLYNADSNQFVMISSMNPLWSAEGEDAKTLADLDDDALREQIERLCGKMKSTTDGVNKITTKKEKDGSVTKTEHNCTDASNKIMLVIPEDDGLKEKIEEIISSAKTNGVEIEVVPSYGKGARATVEKKDEGNE